MTKQTQEETKELVEAAVGGDKAAVEGLLISVQDGIFNLSLRMLGMIPDAEDATQEILIRIMTHLSSFRGESAFETWAYRIAVNHLQNYKKSMFAQRPLSFDFYGEDICAHLEGNLPDMSQGVDRGLLEQELKLSCTNVMLQCLDPESRSIYILGTMFRANSQVAGDILGISPEAYRQRLSRIRHKMGDFLGQYCGLSGTGPCSCQKRIDYAIQTQRLAPKTLHFQQLPVLPEPILIEGKEAMEEMDQQSAVFAQLPAYRATGAIKEYLQRVLQSPSHQLLQQLTPQQ